MRLAIVLLLGGLLTGCGATWPACNQHLDPNAFIVQVANEKQICLEQLGLQFILANGTAISVTKAYTAEQALEMVDQWVAFLENPVTAEQFRAKVYAGISFFPELFIIADAIFAEFGTPQLLDSVSRSYLIYYLHEQVRPLLLARAQADPSP